MDDRLGEGVGGSSSLQCSHNTAHVLWHYTTGGNEEADSEASGSVVRSRCYLVNCALPGGPERDTRSFMPVEDVTRLSRRWLRRCVCSMMNLGKTSTIFMGVLKEGLVKGIKLNKEQVIRNREFHLYFNNESTQSGFDTQLLLIIFVSEG